MQPTMARLAQESQFEAYNLLAGVIVQALHCAAAVFRLTDDGLRLEEIADGIDPERDLWPPMGVRPFVSESLRAR